MFHHGETSFHGGRSYGGLRLEAEDAFNCRMQFLRGDSFDIHLAVMSIPCDMTSRKSIFRSLFGAQIPSGGAS